MIQDHYVPASVEQKTKRIEAEKIELESERAKRKELINRQTHRQNPWNFEPNSPYRKA